MQALFPRYLSQLKSASFMRKSLDDALEERAGCTAEPVDDRMFTEHIDVGVDASDSRIVETFIHRCRPVAAGAGRMEGRGVITRRTFFSAFVARVLEND